MSFLLQDDQTTPFSLLKDPRFLLPIFLISIYPLYHALLTILTPRPLPGIPHRPTAFLFGDALAIGKHLKEKGTPTEFFDELVLELGDQGDGGICQAVFGFFRASRMVVVSDRQEAEDILTKRSHEFDRALDTINMFSPLIPNAQLSFPTNARWKHHRRLMGPAMTSKNLSMFTPRAVSVFSQVVELWKLKAQRLGKEEWFNCDEDLQRAFMDAICEITFGESYKCVESAIEHFQSLPETEIDHAEDGTVVLNCEPPEIFTATQVLFWAIPTTELFPKLALWRTSLTTPFRRASALIKSFLDRKITEGRDLAIARGTEKAELADCVLDLMCVKEIGKDKLDDASMRDELMQFLLAGQETSASTTCWMMTYLSKRPDVQVKLKKELVDLGLADRAPTFADVQADKAPYLEAVVHETLRCSNTAGGVTRDTVKDTNILGHFIPQNTLIYIPLATIQSFPGRQATNDEDRSETSKDSEKNIHPWDPETIRDFDPERWIKDGEFAPKAGPWMPFSMGSRGCYGRALAMLELKLFLAQINLNFFLEKIPEGKQPEGMVEHLTRKPKVTYVRPIPW